MKQDPAASLEGAEAWAEAEEQEPYLPPLKTTNHAEQTPGSAHAARRPPREEHDEAAPEEGRIRQPAQPTQSEKVVHHDDEQ